MSADLSQQLVRERRARLAAERLLEQRQRDLLQANAQMESQSRSLTEKILGKRAELDELRRETDEMLAERNELRDALAASTATEAQSEERLWQALQTMRDGFALFDSQQRLVLANRAYLAIFDGLTCITPGTGYAEICRLMLEEGIVDPQGPPDDWLAGMEERWRQTPIPTRTVSLWNGHFIKLIDRRLPDGGIVALGVDQTESTRMRAAIETIPDGFVVFDRDDKVVLFNERINDMFQGADVEIKAGKTFQEVLEQALGQGLFEGAKGREEEWLEERLAGHLSPTGIPTEQRMSNGKWYRVLEKETPDGGRVGLRVDITPIKKRQAELDRALVAAECASRAKSAFLANMSHEIRTPMNGIVGMAGLLMESSLDDEQKQLAETIGNSAESLLTLLNDVLEFSTIEAETLTLRPAAFNLDAVIADVIRLFQPQARDKGLDLGVDYDLFLPQAFHGDAGRVRQVLINLIGNAVKYTEMGHVLVRVTGHDLGNDDGTWNVHIAVEDTGIGVPAEIRDTIFDSFTQAEQSHSRSHDGAGLGLSICRKIVGLMGGQIWVDPKIETGACFGVVIGLPATEPRPLPKSLPALDAQSCHIVQPPELARRILARQAASVGLCVRQWDHPDAIEAIGPHDTVFVAEALLAPDPVAEVTALRAKGARRIVLLARATPDRAAARAVDLVLPPPHKGDRLRAVLAGRPSDSAPAPVAGEARRESRLRVLAAEDNRTNQLVLKKMLSDFDIELDMVMSGGDALSRVTADPPDLVLMDISMPGMDGREATQRIRAWERHEGRAPLKIVAMTAHAMAGDAERLIAAGLDEVMTKPLKKAMLAEVIEAAEAARRARKTAGAD